MTQVKFGRKQIGNPTPRGVAFKLNVVMAIATAIAGWISSVSFIPARPSTITASILSLVVLICMALKPFYGVETDEKKVPISEVSEMEETNKEEEK